MFSHKPSPIEGRQQPSDDEENIDGQGEIRDEEGHESVLEVKLHLAEIARPNIHRQVGMAQEHPGLGRVEIDFCKVNRFLRSIISSERFGTIAMTRRP